MQPQEDNTMREKVHAFIQTNFIFDDRRVLGDDESLLGTGVIDSTGILELIAFLEKTFGISFDDSELVGENFDSISKIVSFLQRKTTLA
jgi:acyl carrier protein